MSTYLCGSLSNDEYVVELLRAATMQGDQDARVRVQECLGDVVRGWLHSHPNIEASCCPGNEEYYVAMAFDLFWQVTIDQQIEFNALSTGLHYLRASLNGAILDRLRASSRPKAAPLRQTGSSEDPLMEDTTTSAEFWELLQSGLFNEREKRLAYLLFHCGKGPREIVRCSQEFSEIYEIYHLRHNIMERLLCAL